MRFEFGFQSSLLLIFFVHGLVFSVLFWRRYWLTEQSANAWMGLFLLLAALYIAPWMLGFAGWYDNQPYRTILFYVPMHHLYMMGPAILFYVQRLLDPNGRVHDKQWLHLVPGLLFVALNAFIAWYDLVWADEPFFTRSGTDPDFWDVYQITGFLSIGIYFVLALRYYLRYQKLLPWLFSSSRYQYQWVGRFLLAVCFIIVARIIEWIVGLFLSFSYEGAWWYFFAFACCAYVISIAAYAHAMQSKLSFQTNLWGRQATVRLLGYRSQHALPPMVEEPIWEELEVEQHDTASNENDRKAWKQRIHQVIYDEARYTDPDLCLLDLSQALQTNVSVTSRMINQSFEMNFNDLVNSYRIEAFIQRIQAGQHHRETLLAIAYEVGFNSKTTFNRAFKKETGFSPSAYLQQNKL